MADDHPQTTERVFEFRYRRSASPPTSQVPPRPPDRRLLWLAVVLSAVATAAAVVAVDQGEYGSVYALAAVVTVVGAAVSILAYVRG